MIRPAINLLILLCLSALPTLAQSSPPSATPVNNCDGLARACSAAADELKAARDLIKAQSVEIDAAKARLDIEQQRAALESERAILYKSQADNLMAALASEREAKAALLKLSDEQTKRIGNLEKRLSRSKTLSLGLVMAALAAAVALK